MNKLLKGLVVLLVLFNCNSPENREQKNEQPVYLDKPFGQDYAIKYPAADQNTILSSVCMDRNKVVQVLSESAMLKPADGQLQVPGRLVVNRSYQPMPTKNVQAFTLYENQFVYVNDKAVFSNAWAGKPFIGHQLSEVKMLVCGEDFTCMISDGNVVQWVRKYDKSWNSLDIHDQVLQLKFDPLTGSFYILGQQSLSSFDPSTGDLQTVGLDRTPTCFETSGGIAYVGTLKGYFEIDLAELRTNQALIKHLPCPELTVIKEIGDNLWFGSTKGAYMLRKDGKFNYYNGGRWLPSNTVVDIAAGPDGSVLILTDQGLGQLLFKEMTLYDKAMFYEVQVRQRHIRYGLHTDVTRLNEQNDLSSGMNRPADSDNLWTGMYLGSQLFRYLATGDEEAKQNCYEAFEAMERLHEINELPGFYGRSFERTGFQEFRNEYRTYVENYWWPGYNNVISWHHAKDGEWDWRGASSSDQTVGQLFALTLIAEYIDDEDWKQRAIKLIDSLMSHIVDNNMCLVDVDGKPTLWGRWSPEYVNRFETVVGDRKVCSSNIIAFLQAAYHFTGKEKFKDAAFNLMNEHGYLENLMRPIEHIGSVSEEADNWSKMLSAEWNHSDDEMYFLAYWMLYPYAFNDTLQTQYQEAIKDHWESERPEKDALWNFCYAITGAEEFDLDESAWYLREFPLDMIMWDVENSHRRDIEFMEPNFRGQFTKEVLPPDERPDLKHNRNIFKLDGGNRHGELSAGETYLLPYWMGRFLGVISPPVEN